jgi:hypothetical protein
MSRGYEKGPEKPFLDNTGLGAIFSAVEISPKQLDLTHENRVKRNRLRINRLSSLRRKNIELITAMKGYTETVNQGSNPLTDEETAFFRRMDRCLGACASVTLFREHANDGSLEHGISLVCGHKVCPVCNSERPRSLRKLYTQHIAAHPNLMAQNDFMHLTLTVPHSANGGFRGETFYMNAVRDEFKRMRNKPFWKDQVYAGEYCFEFTKNENGIHCHIHALLLVPKGAQNRNLLHRDILYHWNMQTANPSAARTVFAEVHVTEILKSNKLLTRDFVKKLKPNGATMIGLEGLYYFQGGKKNG